MKEKNYSFLAFIKKTIPLFLMMLFVNVGWGQVTLPHTRTSWDAPLTGWTGTNTSAYTTSFACSTNNGAKFDTSAQYKTVQIDSAPDLLSFVVKSNAASSTSVLLVQESDDNSTFTTVISLTGSTGLPSTCSTKGGYQLKTTTRYIKWTFTKGTQNLTMDDVSITKKPNSAPTVSNVSITGLPNTTVELTGTYDYADTESDVDASTYKWYTATDDSGTGVAAIGGATAITYTLTASELGKYIRFGVTAAAATGTSPGAEAFSSWIGPVNSAGTPVLNAGLLADFNATCINTTSDANSFTLMGNNLTGDVTIGALSGFTFSATENGTYTSTLTISPVSQGIDVMVYVKFTPTAAQPYNGNITIGGGGATSVDVSTVASGINTPVAVITGISDALTSSTATLYGSYTEGCSAITSYGIEYSITDGFGTGTSVESLNLNAGNFTVNLSGLESATTYYYKAFATDATGTVYGTQSSFMTEAIAGPTATAATAVTATGFTANWDAVVGATGYELDVYEVVSGTNATDLFISEYIEGSSNNKGIEIYNGTGSTVDLSSYSVRKQSNGSGNFETPLALSGLLVNGEAYVIVNNSANATMKGYADLLTTSAAINFNGNDAVALYNGETQVDVVGIVNQVSDWGKDITLVRNANADVPKIAYNINDWSQLASDTFTNLGSHTFGGGSTTEFIIENQNVSNVNSYPVTTLTPNSEYFYVVRAKDATSTSISSNEIAVTTLNGETTYTVGAWTNGTPTADLDAIIDDNYTTTGNLTAKSLTINSGKVFTVATGNTLTVVNTITNNAGVTGLIIESDAVLLQTSTVANTAMATVKRNSTPLFRQDYTLWSSPVFEPNLRSFSPQTLFNRFYSYDFSTLENGSYKQEIFTNEDVLSKKFVNAKGYLIRMPNDATEIGGTAQTFTGEFKGVLNNGEIQIPLYGVVASVSNGLNLVGNPYPSPISISQFMAENNTNNGKITGVMYFWRKKASITPGNTASGYATYSGAGLVSADTELNMQGLTHIKAGQGFFVQAVGTPGNLVFNNGMRESASTIFFKSTPDATPELNRFWLNLSHETNLVGQTLVAYATDATEGVDSNFDALYFNDSPLALTSIINNNEYIIQAKSLPFLTSDVVTLGFKTDIAGSFTIALSNFDGLFTENQAIYLKDKLNNTLHNLKTEAYTFTSPVGVFNDRFEVQYNGTLGTNNPVALENTILIAVKNQQIKINAGTVTMDKVELIDVAGRVIYTLEGVNATTVTVENVPATNQILIVKISSKENGVVTQKIIF